MHGQSIGGGGVGGVGGVGGGGGAAPHHERISDTKGSGAGMGDAMRIACSSASLSATSQMCRSRIMPVNIGSLGQWLLPMYSPERLTSIGKRIEVVEALSTPSQ